MTPPLSKLRFLLALFLATALRAVDANYAFTSATQYNPYAWLDGGERFPTGAQIIIIQARDRFAIPMYASADPEISVDGRHLLFSGKSKVSSHWQLWEIDLSSHSMRQLLTIAADCIRPLYLGNGDVVYTELSNGQSSLKRYAAATRLAVPLTFAPSSFSATQVLRDGRLLVESNYPTPAARTPRFFTLYPDGTGFTAFRPGTNETETDPRQLANGEVVFTSRKCLMRYTSTTVEKSFVPSTRRLCGIASPIAELAPQTWIISSYERHFAILEEARLSGSRRVLERVRDAHALQPQIIAQRPPLRDFPSGLQNTVTSSFVLGLPSTVAPRATASIKVYTRHATNDTPVSLGEVRVQSDGSYYLELPGDMPLNFEALDHDGKSLMRQTGWIWLRPGERRTCQGCHADELRAMPNHKPRALDGGPAIRLGLAGTR